MKSPAVPTVHDSAASVGELGGEASRSLGALTGLREPVAVGSSGAKDRRPAQVDSVQ
jgi:hypothetical protein